MLCHQSFSFSTSQIELSDFFFFFLKSPFSWKVGRLQKLGFRIESEIFFLLLFNFLSCVCVVGKNTEV